MFNDCAELVDEELEANEEKPLTPGWRWGEFPQAAKPPLMTKTPVSFSFLSGSRGIFCCGWKTIGVVLANQYRL